MFIEECVECYFGVGQHDGQIKANDLFPFKIQRLIVVVWMAFHNFIRKNTIIDQEFQTYKEDKITSNNDDINIATDPVNNNLIKSTTTKRYEYLYDGICNAIMQSHRSTSSV